MLLLCLPPVCVCLRVCTLATCVCASYSSTFLGQILLEVSWSHFCVSIINTYAPCWMSKSEVADFFFFALHYSVFVTRPWVERWRVQSSAGRHIREDTISLPEKKAKEVRSQWADLIVIIHCCIHYFILIIIICNAVFQEYSPMLYTTQFNGKANT